LGRLLPAEPRVTGGRMRRFPAVRAIDANSVLDRELVIQNGIYRQAESYPETARYYFFNFQYAIESDETSLGIWTGCLNATAHSLPSAGDSLLHSIRNDLEDDPAFTIPQDEAAHLFPIALRSAQPEIRRLAAVMEQSANRRLTRDTERINAYYRDLLGQIEKRVARRAADPATVEKERGRSAATELDRAAKLADVVKKYSLKIRVETGDVLVMSLPVREISVRLIRKKAERVAKLHWNPLLGKLEMPWCQSCCGPADPLFLCDDRVHCLCKACLAPCGSCGRQFCGACQAKCKCGAAR